MQFLSFSNNVETNGTLNLFDTSAIDKVFFFLSYIKTFYSVRGYGFLVKGEPGGNQGELVLAMLY